MREVIAVVQAVRRRVYVNLAIEQFFRASFFLVAALTAGVLFVKLVFLPQAMDALAYAALTGAVVVVAYALMLSRIRSLAAAITADEKLGLAERLSTALVVSDDDSPLAQLVVEDARDRARRVNVAARFPISLPPNWRNLAIGLVVLTGILCLPQYDLFGRRADILRRQRDREATVKVVEKVRKQIAEMKKVIPETDAKTLDILKDIEFKLGEIQAAEMGKDKALAALSVPMEKLAERMKEIAKEFAKGAQSPQMDLPKAQQEKMLADAKALLDRMNQLLQAAQLTPEQRDQLAKALEQAAKNREALNAAKDQLDKLAEALQKGDKLTPEQAEQLAKALEQLAKQMAQQPSSDNAQLAQQLQQLAQAMKSGNSQTAQQQLQQAQSLLKTSLKGLNSQMASLCKSAGAMGLGEEAFMDMTGSQSMGEGAQDLLAMAEAMKGLGDMKASLAGAESLSLAEALEELEAAAMLGRGNGRGRGPGMGDWGIGEGGEWPLGQDTGDPLLKDKVTGQIQPGRVISSFLVPGGNIRNETRAELENVVLESKQKAKEALTTQKVPRAYEKVVGGYFDKLEVPK